MDGQTDGDTVDGVTSEQLQWCMGFHTSPNLILSQLIPVVPCTGSTISARLSLNQI